MADAAAWKPARRWVAAKHIGRWGALAAGLVWPLTMLVGATWFVLPGFGMAAYGGAFNITLERPASAAYPPGLYTYKNSAGAIWLLPRIETYGSGSPAFPSLRTDVIIPFWTIALGLGVLGAVGTRRCRPPRLPWLCSACDYDLSATPGAPRCPECGAELGGAER